MTVCLCACFRVEGKEGKREGEKGEEKSTCRSHAERVLIANTREEQAINRWEGRGGELKRGRRREKGEEHGRSTNSSHNAYIPSSGLHRSLALYGQRRYEH